MWKSILAAVLLVGSGAVTAAYAQNAVDGSDRSLAAQRLAAGETITMDGVLDDPVWARAEIADGFRQVAPDENVDPSQPTRVRIAFDATTLYVAFEVIETRPEFYTANVRQRDGDTGVDDFVRIFLDPHQSGRDAYMFVVHPLGARWDALLENNSNTIREWDAIWEARTTRTANGWTAEMAIPFRELSYSNGGSDWGFDAMRYVARNGEVMRWAQIDRTLGTFDVSKVGTLTGISGVDNGLGLEVQAFATARATHIWPEQGRETDLIFDMSGNAFYKITPSLTGTLTVNTDFSDTPLDERIVSLSRFGIFRNETRDFFLQDAAIFEFGGGNFGPSNGLPYFSRNIGRANGQLIDLVGGGKLSGRVGGADVGALVTYMGEGDDLDPQVLAVMRASHEVFDVSRVGVIFTYGDPSGQSENAVAGIDYQHVVNFEGGGILEADAFFIDSYTSDGVGHGQAWGGVLDYTTDLFGWRIRTKSLEENYNPALGFANRPESRSHDAGVRRRWRPDGDLLDFYQFVVWTDWVTDLDNHVQSRVVGLNTELDFANNTFLGAGIDSSFENLESGFSLPGGVWIPPGEYNMESLNMWWNGSNGWKVTPFLNAGVGDFFGGGLRQASVGFSWRPSPVFSVQARNNYTNIKFDTGRTEIYVGSVSFSITPKPDMELITEVQYDNISGNLNLLSRFRWEIRPGSEIFIAVGHNADVPARDFPSDFTSNVSTAVVRIGHTMHW